jgi:hypothetical protein
MYIESIYITTLDRDQLYPHRSGAPRPPLTQAGATPRISLRTKVGRIAEIQTISILLYFSTLFKLCVHSIYTHISIIFLFAYVVTTLFYFLRVLRASVALPSYRSIVWVAGFWWLGSVVGLVWGLWLVAKLLHLGVCVSRIAVTIICVLGVTCCACLCACVFWFLFLWMIIMCACALDCLLLAAGLLLAGWLLLLQAAAR